MGLLVRHPDLTAGPTLVFAPHGDDELVGCGGWLILTRNSPMQRIVVFSVERDPQRKAESQAALADLDIITVDLDLPERGSDVWVERQNVVERIAALIEEVAPRYMFVPSFADPHPDHRQTHSLVCAALARGTTIPDQLTILQYEGLVPLGSVNWWLNISEISPEKQQRLRAYHTQEQRYGLVGIMHHLNSYRGATLFRKAITTAEAYWRMSKEEYVQCAGNLGY